MSKLKLKLPKLKLDNVKVSKKLIFSFFVLVLCMVMIGTLGVYSIKKANSSASVAAHIELAITHVRVVTEHNLGYMYDRQDYRPDIILQKAKLGVEQLDELRDEMPDFIIAKFDSAYSEIAHIKEYSEKYFKSSAVYDSLLYVGLADIKMLQDTLPYLKYSSANRTLIKDGIDSLRLELNHHLQQQSQYKDLDKLDQNVA